MYTETEALELATKILSDKEAFAFRYIQNKKTEARLSATFAAKLFELFLNGRTCEEIHKLNPSLSLGHIVRERIFGDWDAQLEEYRHTILDRVRQRAQDAQVETVALVADMLTVAAKRERKKLATYMQTENEADLGKLNIDSLKDLKDSLEMLLRATGQDTKKVSVVSTSHHTIEQLPTPPATRKLTPAEANKALLILEAHESPVQPPKPVEE